MDENKHRKMKTERRIKDEFSKEKSEWLDPLCAVQGV
jgi:hypothetical protein